MKIFYIMLFLLLTLEGRENPFFPTEGEKDIPLTSNQDTSLPALKRATIALPPQARVLQKVTVEFKNLDGSIESKVIELENSVDWHLPLFISQTYVQEPQISKNIIKKNETSKNQTDTNQTAKTQTKTKHSGFTKIASLAHISFYADGKKLKIVTKDKTIRTFVLAEPHRMVIDFKQESSFASYTQKIPKNIFSVIRVGNHDGYYRVAIELDGLYRYTMQEIAEGYIFTLR